MKIIDFTEILRKVVIISEIQDDRKEHFDDFLYFEMNIFDSFNDVQHRLTQLITKNDRTRF